MTLISWIVTGAIVYLCTELFKMTFMTFKGDKGVYTMVSIPFVNSPPISRLVEVDMVNVESHRKHGSVIRHIMLPNPFLRVVHITNPDLLREIFVGKDWERYTRGTHPVVEPFRPITGGLLFQPNGKEWRDTRDLFSRTFSAVTVRQYVPIINDYVQVLLDQLSKENVENPKGFEVQAIYNMYTFDVISRLVFGASVDSLRTRDRRYIRAWDKGLGLAALRTGLFLLLDGEAWSHNLRDKLFPGLKDSFDEHYAVIKDLINTHVARAQSGTDDGTRSILDDTLRSEKLPGWMGTEELVKQVIALVFAGHDTTAGTLTFATYELSRSPSWQRAIRQEVTELRRSLNLPNDALLPLEPLEGCKNLNAVIKETLRMYPAAPNGAGRVVGEDFVVPYIDTLTGEHKSVEFKKNDLISPFVMGAGRSSENFLRAETWDPQRWIDDATGNGGAINPFANSPFGNGARKCLGERLALAQLRIVLALILEKWELGFCDNHKFVVASQGTIKAGNGVNVKLLPVAA